jgi:hypothetical protein
MGVVKRIQCSPEAARETLLSLVSTIFTSVHDHHRAIREQLQAIGMELHGFRRSLQTILSDDFDAPIGAIPDAWIVSRGRCDWYPGNGLLALVECDFTHHTGVGKWSEWAVQLDDLCWTTAVFTIESSGRAFLRWTDIELMRAYNEKYADAIGMNADERARFFALMEELSGLTPELYKRLPGNHAA